MDHLNRQSKEAHRELSYYSSNSERTRLMRFLSRVRPLVEAGDFFSDEQAGRGHLMPCLMMTYSLSNS